MRRTSWASTLVSADRELLLGLAKLSVADGYRTVGYDLGQ